MMLSIEWFVFLYFLTGVVYTLVFSVAGNFKKKQPVRGDKKYHKIAVLVPAYKEDMIIVGVAKALIGLNYPKAYMDIVVIADSLQQKTLDTLASLDIKLIPVVFEESTKTKSMNAALEQLGDDYDIAVISDADNIPEKDFLLKINEAFHDGHRVVQGQRVAKNLNTSFAVLDAASEIINNHIYRKGANVLGLSSALIGSGMAFVYAELKQVLSKMHAVGGFDKILQLTMIEKGEKLHYVNGALVYDEKVDSPATFKDQRRRWMMSQYKYFWKYLGKGFKLLLQGNFDYFNMAVLHNLFPTRMLMLAGTAGLAIITTVLHPFLNLPFWYWWINFGLYVITLAIALPANFYNKKLLLALSQLPLALFNVILVMFKLKGSDRRFIHTMKTKVEIDNHILK